LLPESRAESRVGHTKEYPTDVGAGTGASSIIADASVAWATERLSCGLRVTI
jgi:hypothetical protein